MTDQDNDKAGIIRMVFDVMPSLIFVVDTDVRVLEYNAAAAGLLMGGKPF